MTVVKLWHHDRYGACSPALLKILLRVERVNSAAWRRSA
jgi:hypothetical protein